LANGKASDDRLCGNQECDRHFPIRADSCFTKNSSRGSS